MTHVCIVGRTKTGKTTLASKIVAGIVQSGNRTVIYNPFGDRAYSIAAGVELQEDHDGRQFEERIYATINENRGAPVFVVIDEAASFFKKQNCHREWLATRGRHHGLNLILICQKFTTLNTVVREQCEVLFLFKCGLKTAEDCADEYGAKALREAPNLPKGHYFRVDGAGFTRGKVFG